MSGIDSGAATTRFFGMSCMRRTIGSKKELWITGCGSLDERQFVFLAFQNGEAVMVWMNSSSEHIVSAHQKMMRSDSGGHIIRCAQNKLDRVCGRNVFHHDSQCRKLLNERHHRFFDEGFFTVKYVNSRVGDFPVHQQ